MRAEKENVKAPKTGELISTPSGERGRSVSFLQHLLQRRTSVNEKNPQSVLNQQGQSEIDIVPLRSDVRRRLLLTKRSSTTVNDDDRHNALHRTSALSLDQ